MSETKPTPRRSWARSALLVAGAFALGGVILPNLHVSWREPDSGAQAVAGGLTARVADPPKTLPESEVYARAAQIAAKAIVNIDTTQRVRVMPNVFDDDWMMGGPRYQQSQSEGSGVIIDASGYILTNEHVVGAVGEAGKKILVTLTDGRKFPGVVLGADHVTDVALVKVEANNLPVARLGTVRGLVPGQMAVAIGNPLGFKFTVSHGVVSALGRPVSTPDGRIYPDLIQHDALINPGNSGGALVNLQGQVIGINTLVYSQAQGIGFAIPIDTALRVADELKRYGRIKRPWVGVLTVTNSDDFVQRFSLPNVAGAVVRGIYRDSPAAGAGLRTGDVVTRLDGKKVRSQEEFSQVEKSLKIGQKIEIEVQRPDERGRGVITVGEAP